MRRLDPVDHALEQLAPSFDHELPFWEDVLMRARAADSERDPARLLGRSAESKEELAPHAGRQLGQPRTPGRRRVRPLVIALLAMLAIALAGTAFALERYVFVGDPAPPEVKKRFADLNRPPQGLLIPRPRLRPPAVLGERARAAAVLASSVGPIYVWVAPTEGGGYCYQVQIVAIVGPDGRPSGGGGGCNPGKSERLLAELSGSRMRDGRFLWLAYGQTPSAARRAELRFADGKVVHVPVRSRFFLAEVLLEQGGADPKQPRLTVVVLAADGRVVGRQPLGHLRRPRFDLDVSGRQPLIEIRTRRTHRPLRLYVFEQHGQRCNVVLHAAWKGGSGGCNTHRPKPNEISVSPEQIGAASDPRVMLLLRGEVGSTIASLELRFDDEKVERIPVVEGWVLFQVDPADLAAGRIPSELVGRDSEGSIIARAAVGG